MKVKRFDFTVWNSGYQDNSRLRKGSDYIEERVNSFIQGKRIISYTVNHFTSNRHNNAGDDTVHEIITIVYE